MDRRTRPEEEPLLAALRRGDQDAYREVFERYDPGLRRLAGASLSPAAADEVVGETWASVVRSLERFEGRSSLKTWIYRILLNTLRTAAAREGRVVPFSALGAAHDAETAASTPVEDSYRGPGWVGTVPSSWDDMPAEELESQELLDMILEAVAMLPRPSGRWWSSGTSRGSAPRKPRRSSASPPSTSGSCCTAAASPSVEPSRST